MADRPDAIHQLARDYAGVAQLGLPRIQQEQPDLFRRMRLAGEDLFAREGIAGMHDAVVTVHRLTGGAFPTGADFNQIWNGVGSWRA